MERYFEKFLLNDISTAGRVKIIRSTCLFLNALTAITTAKYVLPVPAGPILSAGCRVMNHLLDLSKRRELNKMDIGYSLTLIGRQKEEYLTEKLFC